MNNKDIKMSECCTCGTKWRTGQDGRHSCSSKLSKDNHALVEQNKALMAALVEVLMAALVEILETKEGCAPNIYRIGAIYSIADKALEQAR